MARFNPNNYEPTSDSSTLTKAEIKEHEGKIVLKTGEGLCSDGCGDAPKGKKTSFLQGHDARLKGILIRAHVTGTPVVELVDSRQPFERTAMQIAKDRDWGHFLTAAKARLEAKSAKTSKNSGPAVGDTVKAKVGRWLREGAVTGIEGDDVTFEYKTKGGDAKSATVLASEIE